MSGVDAAATLTLRIGTDKAKEDLAALKTEYSTLREELGTPISLAGISESVKKLEASLVSVDAGLVNVKNIFDDILKAGGKSFGGVVQDAENAAVKIRTSLDGVGGSISNALTVPKEAAAGIISQMGLVGKEAADALASGLTAGNIKSEFSLLSGVEQGTLASLTRVKMMVAEANNLATQVGEATARTKFGPSAFDPTFNANLDAQLAAVTKRAELEKLASDSIAISARTRAEEERKAAEIMATANAERAQQEKLGGDTVAIAARTRAAEEKLASDTVAIAARTRAEEERKAAAIMATANAERAQQEKLGGDAVAIAARTRAAEEKLAADTVAIAARTLAEEMRIGAERAAWQNRQLVLEKAYITATDEMRLKSAINARKLMDSSHSGDLTAQFAPQTLTLASGTNLASLEAQLKTLTDSHQRLGSATKQSADHQMHWNTIADEAHGAARGLSGALGGLWLTYGSLAPLLSAAVIAGSMKEMLSVGKELEFQFTVISAISNGAVVDMQKFNAAVAGTMSTPIEAAQGLRVLAQAGLTVEEATKALPSVLKLAAVGETDMANAALSATAIMHSFGLTVNDFAHIGDVFAKAAAISATSVTAMMEAMKQASAISNMFGVSMEETAASLATMANRGIEASAAGTALTNMVRELSAPTTAKSTAAMKQLGIEIFNTDGTLKPFTERLQQLSEAISGMSEKGKTRFLEDVFNNRSVKAANILLTDMEKLKQALEDVRLASEGLGFMGEAQIKLSQSTEGLLKTLKSDFQRVLGEVFSSVQPQIAQTIQSLSGILNSSGVKEFLSTTASAVATLTQALLDNLNVIKTLAEVYLTMKGIEIASAAFRILQKEVGLVTDGLKVLTTIDLASTFANIAAAAKTTGAATTLSANAAVSAVGPVSTMLANLGTIAKGLIGPLTIVGTGIGVAIALGTDWVKTMYRISEEGQAGVKALNDYADANKRVSDEVSKGVDALYLSGVALKEQIRLLGQGKTAADAYATSIRNAPAVVTGENLAASKKILDAAKAKVAAGPQGGGDAAAESREARQNLNELEAAQKAYDKVLRDHETTLTDVTKANAMAAQQGYDKQLIKSVEAARDLNNQLSDMKTKGDDAARALKDKSFAVGLTPEQADATRKRLQQLVDVRDKTATLLSKPLAANPEGDVASSVELQTRKAQMDAVLANYESVKKAKATGVKDRDTPMEKSNIAYLVEQQKIELDLLESKHRNGLITEEKYQSDLVGVYKKHEDAIEQDYAASLTRMAAIREAYRNAAPKSDEFKQADKKFTDMLTAYDKYEAEKNLRVQKAQDLEEGIIKKSWDNVQKFIAEQDAKTATAKEELAAKRLKLDMTPVQSAGYDARRLSYKDSDKQIADATSRVNRLLEAGSDLDSKSLQGALKDLDALRDARERNANEAADSAEKEAQFQREYATGWKKAYQSWADDATNAAKLASDSFTIAANAMESAIDQFLTTGKLNFADFAKSVILGIAKIEARALLAQSTEGLGGFKGIVGTILSFLGAGSKVGAQGYQLPGSGAGAPVYGGDLVGGLHSGGIVGLESTFLRTVPAGTFQNAPRFHKGGVAGDEVPAILKRGEGVFTPNQMRAMGGNTQSGPPINITVHVNGNNTAPDVRRSAGQGAREALIALNGARRYG